MWDVNNFLTIIPFQLHYNFCHFTFPSRCAFPIIVPHSMRNLNEIVNCRAREIAYHLATPSFPPARCERITGGWKFSLDCWIIKKWIISLCEGAFQVSGNIYGLSVSKFTVDYIPHPLLDYSFLLHNLLLLWRMWEKESRMLLRIEWM